MEEVPIEYIPKFREYGIKVLDGGTAKIRMHYCPWCGKKLPESVREKWFELLDEWGLEPNSPKIQKHFLSDKWWKKLKI